MRHIDQGSKGRGKKGLESDGDSDHTQAHLAAASGDIPLLVKAVQQDPGVIQQLDGEGFTPLAHAVHGQHLHAVKRLVKMGADVNAQDSQGRTYLSIAAYQGWSEGVLYLLRKGARQDIVDKSGRTPLHASTYDLDCRSLVALLKRLSTEDVNAMDNEKMTALHWAAFHDRPEHVRHLLQKAADPLLQDIDGKTALHWAAQNGSRSCCFLLADHSEAPTLLSSVDNAGKTAFHLAAAAGKVTVITDLAKIAPELLEADDIDERTPLHWSAVLGHANCIKVMLDLGVIPDPHDVDGVTPLEYARQAKHSQCVALLEDRLGIKHNSKHKSSRDSLTPGEGKRSTVGFFKGLFGKKGKQKFKNENVAENKGDHLPKVNIGAKTQIAKGVPGSEERSGREGCNTLTRYVNGRDSKGATAKLTINYLNSDDGSVMKDSADMDTGEQFEHRKKKKRHKKKPENERDGISSPSTSKTSSTWSDEKFTGNNVISKTSNTRTTHLSPLGNIRPPSISPRLMVTPDHNLPMKRQGELSPLRINRGEADFSSSPLPSQLARLKENSPRTPTPPPIVTPLNLNSRKALPQISSLTQNMESLQLDQKKRKSKFRNEADNVLPSTPETPEVLQNFASASEENGQLPSRLLVQDGAFLNTSTEHLIQRYPSDDAISLYKLSYAKSKGTYQEDACGDENIT